MNEELHWQPMASRETWTGSNHRTCGSPAPTGPGLRLPGDPGVQPPGPQAQNRMALGVKGGGMLGQWYTLSPTPPVGEMPKTRLPRSEAPPTPSRG